MMYRRRGIGGARGPVVFLLVALVVVAALGYYSYTNPGGAASINSSFVPTSELSNATISTESTTMVTTVNGTTYYADNVTSIMVTSLSFHFKNESVMFDGINFQTICTTYAGGCPGVSAPPPGVIVVYPSGPGITLNVTFPHNNSQTIGGGFPIVPVYFHAFTLDTNPQAGILIVRSNSSAEFKSYLLVSV